MILIFFWIPLWNFLFDQTFKKLLFDTVRIVPIHHIIHKGICASHCVYPASSVTAVAGAHNIKRVETSQQKMVLNKFLRHPQYNSSKIQNDISVIGWASSMQLNEFVQPIPMPPKQNAEWLPNGAEVRVCGWGNTIYPGMFKKWFFTENINLYIKSLRTQLKIIWLNFQRNSKKIYVLLLFLFL